MLLFQEQIQSFERERGKRKMKKHWYFWVTSSASLWHKQGTNKLEVTSLEGSGVCHNLAITLRKEATLHSAVFLSPEKNIKSNGHEMISLAWPLRRWYALTAHNYCVIDLQNNVQATYFREWEQGSQTGLDVRGRDLFFCCFARSFLFFWFSLM